MEDTVYRKLNSHFTLADQKQMFDNQLADQFIVLVESNFRTEKTLEFYALKLGVSTHDLAVGVQHRFHKLPSKILREYLAKELKMKLSTTEMPIKELSKEYGFRSFPQFTRFIKSMTGMTPTRYRALKCFDHH